MKTTGMTMISAVAVPAALGLVGAALVIAVWRGKPLPLEVGPRAALAALLAIGMVMCTGGIGQVGASGRWGSPAAIVGCALGAAILVIGAAGLAGWKLPGIANTAQAVTAVGALMAVKLIIGAAGYFLRWL